MEDEKIKIELTPFDALETLACVRTMKNSLSIDDRYRIVLEGVYNRVFAEIFNKVSPDQISEAIIERELKIINPY